MASRLRVSVLPALVVGLALCGGGCGGGSIGPGTTNPTASAPDAPAPPPDATQPGTGPVTTQTAPPATTTQPAQTQTDPAASANGGGGAQAVRVPAAFVVVAGGRLRPATITVPPFLAVELSVASSDGAAHRLVLQTPTPHALAVASGRRAAVRIPGLRAGRYPVTLDGRPAGALVAGGEVGP